MSKQVEKDSVFRTTKVRTKLKGDASWLQRNSDAETETDKEKPWLAEVRASRLNGAPVETSPVSSPTTSTPSPTKSDAERAPSSGYLIRGIFTKLDKPTSSSTTNGVSPSTTQFTKKPSESYKKIAPYTVRPTPENQEDQLSNEEQEKRTEAASNVLKKSTVRQRSYVLSAAKKYESPETSLVNSSPAFVARRVETTDDDGSAATPAPASALPPSPVVPVASVASKPETKPWKAVDTSVRTAVDVAVNEPVAPKVVEPAPEPVKDDPPPMSVTVEDTFEDMKPVVSPLPVVIPKCFQAASTEPEPKHSDFSWKVDTHLVDLAPASPSPISPTAAAPAPASPVPLSPTQAYPVPLSPTQASPVPLSPTQAYPVPLSPTQAYPVPLSPTLASPVPLSPTQAYPVPLSPTQAYSVPLSPTLASPVPLSPAPVSAVTEILVKTEPEPELAPKPSRKSSSRVDTLTTLSDTLIAFDSSSTSFKDDEPVLAEEEAGSANSHTTENGVEQEPAPELSSSSIPMTDDLLAFTNGPEESAEPVPPSPGRWSQDLLSGLNSESKTSGTLDLLADNVIPIKTRSLSMQREEKQTDETAKETQSVTETVTITTKTVIITDKSQEDNADPWSSRETTTVTESSSADPFDPYPIGTTSSNSASDLIQPRSDISSNSASVTFMENRYPSPETDLSTQRSWARTWETSPPQQADTEESQEAVPGGQTVDQETLIKFERKSSENDSPWDRWTSPTVYTITTTTGGEGEEEEEEEKEKERTEYSETETITTITTIRERHSEQQLAMDRYGTYSSAVTEEDQRVQTPEPEARKSFVYVKEYVNATELSMHNARDSPDNGSDYLTSSSANYSSSSPSTYSSGLLSSTCNFCGETVGNDAKISIEHLNINCHPACFKCGVCRKPMGDLLDSMFLHDGKVLCETCYSNSLD